MMIPIRKMKNGCFNLNQCCGALLNLGFSKKPKLNQMVSVYKSYCAIGLREKLDAFKGLPLKTVVKTVAMGKEVNGKRIFHLRRINKDALQNGYTELKSKLRTRKCDDFERVFEIVNGVAAETKGLGPDLTPKAGQIISGVLPLA